MRLHKQALLCCQPFCSSFDAFLTHLLSLWFCTNSCQPLTGSFCQVLFPRTFKSVFNIPGRVNRENDVFHILEEVAPFLDYTCNKLMYLNACFYINPLCSENGMCLTEFFLWSKSASFTAFNNIMASFLSHRCPSFTQVTKSLHVKDTANLCYRH